MNGFNGNNKPPLMNNYRVAQDPSIGISNINSGNSLSKVSGPNRTNAYIYHN